jgi:ABC-2 type transport system permease protein
MILIIAARELRGLLVSPLAWVVMALAQALLAWLFLVQIDLFMALQPRLAGAAGAPGVTDLVAAPLLANAGTVLMFLVPLLSTGLLGRESATGTLPVLFSAPVSLLQIVLGKYLGLLAFLGLLLALTAAMPLSLLAGTQLDLGKLAAALLGLALVLAATGAIGLYASSCLRQPAAAAALSLSILLFLWLADQAGVPEDGGFGLFQWLSLGHHFQFLLRGLVRSIDVVYFLLLILLPLGLSVQRLAALRRGY